MNGVIDRRTFIAAGSATAALVPVALRASPLVLPRRNLLIINTLGAPDDTYGPKPKPGDPPISQAGINALRSSGVTAINVTIAGGMDATFADTSATIARYDHFLDQRRNELVKVLTAADILSAKRAGKAGIIYGFQGTSMLGADVANVDAFASMGVRIIQLTYNSINLVGGGALSPADYGLTDFGRAVVARLNDKRVIVDLSHANRQTTLDAARASTRPIAITHTGCRAIADVPRNKTDEELRSVADKGGYVGIYFMPFLAPGRPFGSEDVAQHIEHAIKVCGEDHVGVGSDHGLTPLADMSAVRAYYAKIVNERRAQGISAPGEDPALLPYGTDLIGPAQFRVLADTLARRKHPARRIEKIMGRNFLDFAETIWGR
jgi:membrane dipeptidase